MRTIWIEGMDGMDGIEGMEGKPSMRLVTLE